jgi:hypothetical protein
MHRGYDTEVSTAPTQSPEQLIFTVMFGGHDAAIRKDHFR